MKKVGRIAQLLKIQDESVFGVSVLFLSILKCPISGKFSLTT